MNGALEVLSNNNKAYCLIAETVEQPYLAVSCLFFLQDFTVNVTQTNHFV